MKNKISAYIFVTLIFFVFVNLFDGVFPGLIFLQIIYFFSVKEFFCDFRDFIDEKSKKNYYIIIAVFGILCLLSKSSIFLSIEFSVILFMQLIVYFKNKDSMMNQTSMPSQINQSQNITTENITNTNLQQNQNIQYCSYCNNVLNDNDIYCAQCGKERKLKTIISINSFDKIYQMKDDEMITEFINRKMQQVNFDTSMVSRNFLNKKILLNSILSLLLFVFVFIIFFHFPIYTYIIGIVIMLIYFILLKKYTYTKYLKRIVISRPSEKISNIVMNEKNNLVKDKSKLVMLITSVIAIIIPLILFKDPVILYEKKGDGYAVRYYIFGVTNFKTVTIPEEHNGKKVISLRGNTFSNMPFLTSVSLPDTITEIRGQAFKNDISLKNIELPSKLEYLGGGAFSGCFSLKSISLPDTLTYLGGEAFKDATNLESVKLSENLTQIRGYTFSNCNSLKSIKIPDKVTRIGARAFYHNNSLSNVEVSENSQLREIGSSAFRECDSLMRMKLPNKVVISDRAFKNSPTIVSKYGSGDYYE